MRYFIKMHRYLLDNQQQGVLGISQIMIHVCARISGIYEAADLTLGRAT